MKRYITILITLIATATTAQVKFTQMERAATKWNIPVAKRVVPGIPDFVMTYMTLANLIDSTEIELGTKIDSMKWATGDTLKLYTSDGVFKTKITFTGMGTVTGTGTATRVAFWSGTSSLSSNANLYWDNINNYLGVGTASPSYPLHVSGISGISKIESTLTNGTAGFDFNNPSTWWRVSINAEGGSTNNLHFRDILGGRYPLTLKQSNGYVGVNTLAPSYQLDITGDLRVTDRSGTPQYGAAFDSSGKLVTTGVAPTTGTVTGTGTATRVAFWSGTSSLSSNANLYWDNINNYLGVGTASPSYPLHVSGISGISKIESTLTNGTAGFDFNNPSTWWRVSINADGGSTNNLHFRDILGGRYPLTLKQSNGYVGVNNAAPLQQLDITGTMRLTGSDGTATGLMGRDADGDVSAVGLGSGLAITGGTLNYTETGTGDITGITVSAPITGTSLTGPVPNIAADTSSTVSLATRYDLTLKENFITPGTTSQYWRGDKTWQTLTTGVTTLAAIGSSPNANGATISGSTLNLQPASASFGGVVTTGTQTFAGSKTFDYLGGTEGTNLTTGTSLIMATNAGKLENLYGTAAGYDLPLYNPTGNNWELTKLKTVNGNSLLGSGNVAISTDLSFTGASSPYTLNSNTGNDVTFAAGSGVTLSRSGDQLTIASSASGMTSWNLAASGTPGSQSITNGTTATITAGTGIAATRVGGNITISSTAAASNDQYWLTDNNTAYHQIRMQNSVTPPGNSDVSLFRLTEGSGIDVASSGNIATVTALSSSVGQLHNSGSTSVDYTTGANQKIALGNAYTLGSSIAVSDANDRFTINTGAGGNYMITFSGDIGLNSTTAELIIKVRLNGTSDIAQSQKIISNSSVVTAISKTFYASLSAGDYIELFANCNETITANIIWYPTFTIQRVN